ncbi:MAG: hypothetical protein VYB80_04655 [Actinomycetota bacterium]|nr:hypothetical protein [Actinomycetota bacterium]
MIDPFIDRLLCRLINAKQKQPVLDVIHGEIERRQLAAELRVKDAWLKASNVESYVE